MSAKSKVVFILLLCAATALSSIVYYRLKKKGDTLIEKTGTYLSQKTGRKVEIASIKYSPLEGLILRDVAIKEKDGKTDFFRFKKAEVKIDEKEFIKGNLIFENASFHNGRLRLERKNGEWNFKDLMSLLPPSKKPVHLVWNAREFSFENFDFYLIDESKAHEEITLNNTAFSLSHRSATGGNFSFTLRSSAGAILYSKLFSCEIDSAGELNYDYASLKGLRMKTQLKKISYDQMSADSAYFSGEFFELNQKGPKNFRAEVSLNNFFIPSSDSSYSSFLKKLEKAEKALGRNISMEKEFSLSQFRASVTAKKLKADITLSIDSNLLSLELLSSCDLTAKSDTIKAELTAGSSKIKVDAVSNFSNVNIKQEFSETASGALKSAILEFEKGVLLKILQ